MITFEPILQLSPIETFFSIIELWPIKQFDPIFTLDPIKTFLPNLTFNYILNSIIKVISNRVRVKDFCDLSSMQ